MLNITKEKLDLSPELAKKIDWAKKYTSTSITLEKVLKLIPIIKDIYNPENISNKFKLGIITSTIETIKHNHNQPHLWHNYGHKKNDKLVNY